VVENVPEDRKLGRAWGKRETSEDDSGLYNG